MEEEENKKEKIKYLKRRPNLIKKMIKIYNNTCEDCKKTILRNKGQVEFEKLCEGCQDMATKIYDT